MEKYRNIKNKKKSKQTEKIEEDEFLKSLQNSIENYQEFSNNLLQNTNPIEYRYKSIPRSLKAKTGYVYNQLYKFLDNEKENPFSKLTEEEIKKEKIIISEALKNDVGIYNDHKSQILREVSRDYEKLIQPGRDRQYNYFIQEDSIVLHLKKDKEKENKKNSKTVRVKSRGKNLYSDSNNYIETIVNCPDTHKFDHIPTGLGTDHRNVIGVDVDFKDVEDLTSQQAFASTNNSLYRLSSIIEFDLNPSMFVTRVRNNHIQVLFLLDEDNYCPNRTRNAKKVSLEEQMEGYRNKIAYDFTEIVQRKSLTLGKG